jgi:flagellar basal-body rod protein FlgB
LFITGVTNRGSTPALVATMVHSQARLRTIAENVANSATPGYRAKQLDVKGFQRALQGALEDRAADPKKPLRVQQGEQVQSNDLGSLTITPQEQPVQNLLFHDGTNLSLEEQMSDLAQAGLTHDLASRFLMGRYSGLRKAISGQVT